MKNQGRLIVVVIFGVALAATLFAWSFRLRQSQHVLEFYGGDAASRIRRAQDVQWLPVKTPSPTSDLSSLTFDSPVEIVKQPGLIHARAALISDVSYDWDAPAQAGNWKFAIRFRDSDGTTTLAFDLDSYQCAYMEDAKIVALGPKIVEGLTVFVNDVNKKLAVGK